MLRKALGLGLMALLLFDTAVSADDGGRSSAAPAKSTSSTKRVVWTLVGIGAGFGAGLIIGLHAFDDSINSDRKVWTSAIAGAAAGGLAGGLLSRQARRVSPDATGRAGASRRDVRVAPSLALGSRRAAGDDLLRRRVGEVSSY